MPRQDLVELIAAIKALWLTSRIENAIGHRVLPLILTSASWALSPPADPHTIGPRSTADYDFYLATGATRGNFPSDTLKRLDDDAHRLAVTAPLSHVPEERNPAALDTSRSGLQHYNRFDPSSLPILIEESSLARALIH